jgi:formylglycine-generating enzyme required for sulfatase activity
MGVGYQHVNTPPIPPVDINPAVPVAVSDVVLKALAKTPPDRYQSAGELATALEEAARGDSAENEAENVQDTAYFVRPLPPTEAHDGAGLGGHTPPSSKPRLPTWLQQPLPGVGPEGGAPLLLDTRPRTNPRGRFAVPALVGGLVIICLVGLAVVLSVAARILPNGATPTSTIVAAAPTLTASRNSSPTPVTAPPSATPTLPPVPTEPPIITPPTLVPSPDAPTVPANGGSNIPVGTTRTDAKNIAQVWVPDGCFMQGSDTAQDSAAQPDETPHHQVCFTRGFWIDQYEVTNAAFQAFVDDNGYRRQELWSVEGWQWLQSHGITGPLIFLNGNNGPQYPRVGISWYEASAYARWRGGRLPTEAEWEYAARGPESRIYPWGNNYQNGSANVDEQSVGGQALKQTAPVGSYQSGKSWVNAHDLIGNVWEWTLDWYDGSYYQQQVKTDPAGPANGTGRVLRGGSWSTPPQCARAACRRLNYRGRIPDLRDETVGFRIVVSDPGAGPASPTPTQVAVNGQCPGYLRTRMAVGRQGRVTPGDPNRLREEPNGKIIGRIPAEGVFQVIEGPSCGPEGMVWWRVNFEGQVGWTAEGKGAFYYLEPWPPSATPPPPTQ